MSDIEKREKGNGGKITEGLVLLEGEESNAAEKFLFRTEAVLRFQRAGKCERARDVQNRFVAEDDVPSVLSVDEYVDRRLTLKEKKSLKSLKEYKEHETFVKGAAYAKNPESVRNRNLLAMEYDCRVTPSASLSMR